MGLLYSRLKIFHFKEKVDSLPLNSEKIMAPLHIRIKPTNVCNHNCWYCAYRSDNMQLGKDMIKKDFIPREKMIELIEDISAMGVQAVTFSGGGDPLCYPYIEDAVRQLSGTSIRFALLTNGSRLKGEVAEIFAHHGTWLRISMDGWDDESYARYRSVPAGEFTKIARNIESFKKHGGRCHLGISLIVGRENAVHVYEQVRRLKSMGVNSVKVSPCVVSNDATENNTYHQPVFERVKEDTAQAISDFADESFEIYDSYHALDDKFRKDYNWCPYLQILPIVGADLNIYSCQDKAYNLDEGLIGTIKQSRFKEFWFSDKNNFFKVNPAKVCNHHCVANEKNRMVLEYLDSDKEHLGFV